MPCYLYCVRFEYVVGTEERDQQYLVEKLSLLSVCNRKGTLVAIQTLVGKFLPRL